MDFRAPTLDQLHVFLAVVEGGSFSQAAKHLNRAPSVISYTIANLEQHLGVKLFQRNLRRPQLTASGLALLADARDVMRRTGQMMARARALSQGQEARLDIAVDTAYPPDLLAAALKELQALFPDIAVHLHMSALGGPALMVADGKCDCGVASFLTRIPEGLGLHSLGALPVCTVAAPEHPLAREQAASGTAISSDRLASFRHILMADRSNLVSAPELGVPMSDRWSADEPAIKLALIRTGLGWGHLPEWQAADDLARGILVRLRLEMMPFPIYPLFATYRTSAQPGPVARWLLERLRLPTA